MEWNEKKFFPNRKKKEICEHEKVADMNGFRYCVDCFEELGRSFRNNFYVFEVPNIPKKSAIDNKIALYVAYQVGEQKDFRDACKRLYIIKRQGKSARGRFNKTLLFECKPKVYEEAGYSLTLTPKKNFLGF